MFGKPQNWNPLEWQSSLCLGRCNDLSAPQTRDWQPQVRWLLSFQLWGTLIVSPCWFQIHDRFSQIFPSSRGGHNNPSLVEISRNDQIPEVMNRLLICSGVSNYSTVLHFTIKQLPESSQHPCESVQFINSSLSVLPKNLKSYHGTYSFDRFPRHVPRFSFICWLATFDRPCTKVKTERRGSPGTLHCEFYALEPVIICSFPAT